MAIPTFYTFIIYSNDGSEILAELINPSATYYVTVTGLDYNIYTYSGDKKFIGLSTSANATTPTYAIGDSFTINSDTNLYIVEGEANAITDLTNTKWEVSSGWSCVSNYGRFSINYILDDTNACIEMVFGYNPYSGESKANYIFATCDMSNANNTNAELTSTTSFVINIIDGVDVTNSSLISWLETYGEQIVEEETKPTEYTLRIDGVEVTDYENVIVNGVSYKCKKGASVPTDLTGYTVTIPSGWSVDSDFDTLSVKATATANGLTFPVTSIYMGYGYNNNHFPLADSISIYGSQGVATIVPQLSFTITFSYVSPLSDMNKLIQWFVDNNATFTKVEQQKTIYVHDINGGATYTFNVGNASTYGDITFPCYDVNGEKYLFLNANDNSSLNIVLNSSQVNRDVYHIYTGSLSNVVKITDSIENGVTLYCTSSGHSGGTID